MMDAERRERLSKVTGMAGRRIGHVIAHETGKAKCDKERHDRRCLNIQSVVTGALWDLVCEIEDDKP